MPHISTRRLHTRDYVSRVLRRAGQFAHVSTREIDRTLADAYNVNRFVGDEDTNNYYLKEAVPLVFIKASRSKLPRLYDADGTLRLFQMRYGYLCPLCLSPNSWRTTGSKEMAFFFCPTFLSRQPSDLWDSGICDACYGSMSNWHSRQGNDENFYRSSSQTWMAAVAWMFAKSNAFKRRVRSSKHRKLRFDPRRSPLAASEAA